MCEPVRGEDASRCGAVAWAGAGQVVTRVGAGWWRAVPAGAG